VVSQKFVYGAPVSSLGGAVLVVDDDVEIRVLLREVLSDDGYTIFEAGTGAEALQLVKQVEIDVVLLDLGLPDASGLDLLTQFTADAHTSVIILTGRAGETDRVVGLDLGADDYIAKPFSTRELVARVNAVNRRNHRGQLERRQLCFGSLVIDQDTRDVMLDGVEVALTPKEFDVLAFLAGSPRRVYSKGQLLRDVWGSSPEWQDDTTVGEHMHRIRRKLDPADRERWVQTIRGVGYRFVPPSEC
jgi:two-component system phosphate regulon response regulator PhoB